jgi:GTP-binding protein
MHGANGRVIELAVPLGTIVFDEETGAVLGDLTKNDERLVVAQGGRGGRGNARFASSIKQAPDYAQSGLPGEERCIRLELKLLADVGLVGFPNAGKSTLIRSMSRSRAKVADYPFTTLVPNLGVVPYDDDKAFVIADVPGLVEGASRGVGLGHKFLKHIERTRVLVFLLDAAGDVQPREAWETLTGELRQYDPALLERAQITCLNKADLVDEEWLELCVQDLAEAGCPQVITISALEGKALNPLRKRIIQVLNPKEDNFWD